MESSDFYEVRVYYFCPVLLYVNLTGEYIENNTTGFI